MSKDIVIQQNGVTQNLTVDKIRTKSSGKTATWVPEDEVQVAPLYVNNKTGEFLPEDYNLYGFNEVVVTGIKTNDQSKLMSKSVDANGVYTAAEDGVYGYSSVHVHVRGGGSYVDPDTGETVTPDPSEDDGSSVVGTNTDTGNEELIEIEDGELITTELASSILIDTPPDKLSYNSGEKINLTGAIVRGYLKDGMPYKEQSYAKSIIEHKYLMLVPDKADISQVEDGGSIVYDNITINYCDPAKMYNQFGRTAWEREKNIYGYYNITNASDIVYGIMLYLNSSGETGSFVRSLWSKQAFSGTARGYDNRTVAVQSSQGSYGGITYHNVIEGSIADFGEINVVGYPEKTLIPGYEYVSHIVPALFGGEEPPLGFQTIKVQWPREGDRKILEAEFEISVSG